jgi:hypothetical protein
MDKYVTGQHTHTFPLFYARHEAFMRDDIVRSPRCRLVGKMSEHVCFCLAQPCIVDFLVSREWAGASGGGPAGNILEPIHSELIIKTANEEAHLCKRCIHIRLLEARAHHTVAPEPLVTPCLQQTRQGSMASLLGSLGASSGKIMDAKSGGESWRRGHRCR